MATLELPVTATAPSGERADAARNRAKVLKAARRLFEERGVENVSMDDIAAAAGVGKGTLFRRFGDRATLARSLLSECEGAFQESLIRGPAPVGPGAAPRERLLAFGEGLLELLDSQGDLVLAAERGSSSCARYQSQVYEFYRTHVTLLLREAEPDLGADYAADVLLSALSAEFFSYQRSLRELSLEEVKRGWRELVERLCASRSRR